MDTLIFKISLLRVQDVNRRSFNLTTEEKAIAYKKYENKDNIYFVTAVYKDDYYQVQGNFDLLWYLRETQSREINVGIMDTEISRVKKDLLQKVKKEQINPMLMGIIYKEIMHINDFSQNHLANIVDKSQGAISNKLRLLKLPTNVQNAILSNKIKERHGRAILQLEKRENFLAEANVVLVNILEKNLKVVDAEDVVFKILDKQVGVRDNLNMKKVKSRKDYVIPETGIIVDKIDKEMEKTIVTINKMFPKLEIKLEQGIDREDYVFLLKLKGVNNGKNNSDK